MNIKLDSLSYDDRRVIERIREAEMNGHVYSVSFFSDGSGLEVYYLDPLADHGCPCSMRRSFSIEYAPYILAGFRYKHHELNTCM